MSRKLTTEEARTRYTPETPQPVEPFIYEGIDTKIPHICPYNLPGCKKIFDVAPCYIWRKTTRSCGCYRIKLSSCKNYTNLNKEQLEILDGLIISDGCIYINKKHRSKNATFSQSCIHQKYLQHIKNTLSFSFGKIYKRNGGICKICSIQTKYKTSYSLMSLADTFLTKQHYRWYKNGKKTIPKDLKITPLMLKYWFYGDGSTSFNKHYISLTLYTNSFTYQECKTLQQKLKFSTNIKFHINKTRVLNQYVLKIGNKDSINKFFNYIGPCELECFKYKWKIPEGI